MRQILLSWHQMAVQDRAFVACRWHYEGQSPGR